MKFFICLLTAFSLTSCATDTGVASKDRAGRVTNAVLKDVFNIALQSAMSYGTASLTGQNGQDAAKAAFISAARVDGVAAIHDIMLAYAGPQITPVADSVVSAIARANPQTPADKVLVLNTVGAALQQVANQKFGG